jgi:hypothetical protein
MEEKLPTNARPLISPQQRKSRKTKESWNEIPNYRCCWSAMHCRSSDAWLTKVVNRHSSWDSHAPSHQREDFFEDILCRKISESVSFCPPCGISCRSLGAARPKDSHTLPVKAAPPKDTELHTCCTRPSLQVYIAAAAHLPTRVCLLRSPHHIQPLDPPQHILPDNTLTI